MCIFTRCPTFLLIAVMLCRPMGSSAGEPIRLIQDGQAVSVVVIPDSAGRHAIEAQAASLLVNHLRQMSGGELPIYREGDMVEARVAGGRIEWEPSDASAGSPAGFVLLGETQLADALGVTSEGLGVGGMRVRTIGNALVLRGGPVGGPRHADAGGVRYAVIELLEQLGCRYLWPGETGKVVPQRPTVELPGLDIAYTPPLGHRTMRWSRLGERGQSGLDRLGIDLQEYEQAVERAGQTCQPVGWSTWQRLGGQMPRFGHGGAGLRDAERHLQENPQWFALQADGTRDQGGIDRWRLCKSNPQLIQHVAQDIIQRRHQDPDLALVSLCPNDGGYASWCLCEACQELDPPHGPPVTLLIFERAGSSRRSPRDYVSLTDRMVFYWNQIAEKVTREHPDLLFGVSAYSRFSQPPVEQRLHPNLVVRYVPSDVEGWDGWVQAGAQRIYYRPNILLINRRHGKLQSLVGPLAGQMSHFADKGMAMTDFDSIYHHWSTLGLTYYATARLNWNPHLSAESIIADYAHHGFGSGGDAIERFFHRVESLTEAGIVSQHTHPDDYRYTPEVVQELRTLLNTAERAAADDERIGQRIAFLRLGLNFTELQEVLDDKARRADQDEPFDERWAQRLVDLNALILRDLLRNQSYALNVPGLVWGTGGYTKWRSLGGRRVTPRDESWLKRLDDPRYGLTGREQSIAELFAAYGLEG